MRCECRLSGDVEPMVVRFGSLEFVKQSLAASSAAMFQLEEAESKQKR